MKFGADYSFLVMVNCLVEISDDNNMKIIMIVKGLDSRLLVRFWLSVKQMMIVRNYG